MFPHLCALICMLEEKKYQVVSRGGHENTDIERETLERLNEFDGHESDGCFVFRTLFVLGSPVASVDRSSHMAKSW